MEERMNYEEALNEIKKQIADAGYVYNDFLDICKEALEKQIPKKPITVDEWVMCPNCYEKYGFSYDILVGMRGSKSGEVHCLNCGQLIDMEVKE
jgi:hypothetical protein